MVHYNTDINVLSFHHPQTDRF